VREANDAPAERSQVIGDHAELVVMAKRRRLEPRACCVEFNRELIDYVLKK
jgi:hypothetical protein